MKIIVTAKNISLAEQAQRLAADLQLAYSENTQTDCDYILVLTLQGLELSKHAAESHIKPLKVDFLNTTLQYRLKHSNKNSELLARAIGLKGGLKKSISLSLIDATAGLGEDAYILAHLGCQVLMLERSPIVAALLADGLQRLRTQLPDLALTLHKADSIVYLQKLSPEHYPDVIYLDPMYPERNKTALPKKDMLWLRDLVGNDNDAADLLPLALTRAKQRVVVKRPRLAETIAGLQPSLSITGSSCRFDVYLINKG